MSNTVCMFGGSEGNEVVPVLFKSQVWAIAARHSAVLGRNICWVVHVPSGTTIGTVFSQGVAGAIFEILTQWCPNHGATVPFGGMPPDVPLTVAMMLSEQTIGDPLSRLEVLLRLTRRIRAAQNALSEQRAPVSSRELN